MKELYEWNLGSSNHTGVALCHKFTLEHIYLTSFSKMRVDLAAQVIIYYDLLTCSYLILMQVMSERVSKTMLLTGGSEAFETSCFIGKVDKFFDCLNVINYTSGRHSRKKFLMPYFKLDDFRSEVFNESCHTLLVIFILYSIYVNFLHIWIAGKKVSTNSLVSIRRKNR